ncbi:MAG TPA: class I SAM-dependent methyltransferase [Acidobacteriota bacterium]|nr:class I SAM-dependent methyltransferase [Acidobacteriota bacterium]
MPGTNVIRIFDDQAKIYDQRWASYIEASVRETIARLEFTGNEKVLELACGTGALTFRLLEKWSGLNIIGLDISRGMLLKARERLGNRFPLVSADVHQLPFAAGEFDVVISCNAFHYWRHPRLSLREASRVLVPAGRLIITDWCDDYLACRLCDYYLRLFDRTHYRMYGSADFRELLESVSFSRIQLERYKISWLWGLMTVSARWLEGAGGEQHNC